MADVSFIRRNTNDPFCDMVIVDGDIAFGDELESMVLVSLLTDTRATTDEFKEAKLSLVENPNNVIKLGGWWGDTYASIQGSKIGSKLWLNSRQKATNDVRINTVDYAEQALQYLIDDGIVSTIEIEANWTGSGIMEMLITIKRPDGSLEEFRYQFAWGAI